MATRMGEVVSIKVAASRKSEDVNRLFEEYVAAKRKFDETLDGNDAIAAAKIWKRFLEIFCGKF